MTDQKVNVDFENSLDEEKLPFDSDEEMSNTEFEYSSDSEASGSDSDESLMAEPKLPDITVHGYRRNQQLPGGQRNDQHIADDVDESSDSEPESDFDDIEMPDLDKINEERNNGFQMSEEERRIWLEVIPNRYPSIFVRREDFARMNV